MCRREDFPPYDPLVALDIDEAGLDPAWLTKENPMTDITTAPPAEPLVIESPGWAVIKASGSVKFMPGKPTLADIQGAVGGYIERVPAVDAAGEYDEAYTAYCNEEGKLEGLPINNAATRFTRIRGDLLMGDVVVVGPPDDEGEDTPLPVDVRMRLVHEVAEA